MVLGAHQHPVEQRSLAAKQPQAGGETLRRAVDLEQALALGGLDLDRGRDEVGEQLGVGRQPELERIRLADCREAASRTRETRWSPPTARRSVSSAGAGRSCR